MAKDLDLKVRISAELGEIKSALNGLKGDLAKVSQSTQQNTKTLSGAFDSIKRSVMGLAAAWASFATAKQLIDMADQAAQLDARLKLATSSAEEFTKAQGALADIATRTRSSLADTIDLYSRLSRYSKELNVSQDTLLSVTETINQAVQLSGVSAESANAALIQLGQGLASGTLRGEELNSVLEQTPRLAQAIAEGMGITVGQLRAVAAEGQITAEEVVNALVKQKDAISNEFGQLPLTVGQSMTLLKNSILQAVGDMNEATGATSTLAAAIAGFAQWLNSGVLQQAFLSVFGEMGAFLRDLAQDFVQSFDTIRNAFGSALEDMGADTDALKGATGDTVDFMIEAFRHLPTNVRAFLQIIVTEAAYLFDRVALSAKTFKDKVEAIFTDDTMAAAEERFQQELKNIQQAREDSISAIMQERDAHIEAGKAAQDRYKQEKTARETAAKTVGAPGTATRKATPGDAAAVDEFKVLQEQIKGQLQALDAAYKEAEISTAAYYQRRRELQLQSLDAELADRQAALGKAKDADAKSKVLTDIETLKVQRQALIAESSREQVQAENQLQDQLTDIRAKALASEGKLVEARRMELEAQYKDTLARMKAEGDTAGVELINKLINTEVADAKLQELETKIKQATDAQRFREEDIGRQNQIGAIGDFTASDQINTTRATTITQLQQYRSELAQLYAETQNPAAAQAIAQLDSNIQNMGQTAPTIFSQIGESIANNFSNAFSQLISGTKSAAEAFRDMARSILQDIAKLAAQAMFKELLGGMAKGGAGGGGAFAEILGAFVKHTGGIAGVGGTMRRIPAFAFAGAPRYHSGGVAGLKPGEVPAILKKGEEVLTRNDPRHQANGGGQGGGAGVRILNVIDPNMVSDYMSSSQGEQVLLNVLQRNAGSIRQVLA